jgi:arylsulfatase A-like enzyme
MQRRQFLSSLAAPLLAKAQKPNIILILADDMGFSDIGCYGSEIPTPHLDSLAKGGVRFTHFYNTARCCPTRASLLSGLYAHQASIGHMVDGRELPGYRGDLNPKCLTLAEALKRGGYQTRMSGKWHVTPVTKSKHNWPNQRGFDKFFGTIHGAGSFYAPPTLTEDNEPVEPGKDFYYTDAIANKSVDYIRECTASKSPFFLYTAFTAPHWPMHAFADDIARHRQTYKKGWDQLRLDRHKRQIELGIVDPKWTMAPRGENIPAWNDAPNKEWQIERMAIYAAMVERMDQGIGRMIGALKEANELNNTLICFLSDNGGCAEELGSQIKARHVPLKTRAGEAMYPGNDPSRMPGPENTYQTYGVGWANASNTPFRMYKHWVHEGGISSPFIAHFPGVVAAPGSITHQPGHIIDAMPTFLDASKTKYPSTAPRPEGMSLLPAFRGKDTLSNRTLCWEHEGNRAIRQGQYKLVSKYPGDWELFDLKADRTESNDLHLAQATRAADMARTYQSWATRAGVEPWDKVQSAPKIPLLLD